MVSRTDAAWQPDAASGEGIAGIAVVVIAGVLVSGWHRLGAQSPQVTFTALFGLLLGGYQPVHYITHRMVDVGIGVATGLAVNVLVFPPLQLRPAEHAIRQWGNVIACALEDLSAVAADPDSGMRSWPRHDHQLAVASEQARRSARRARESLRWNLRAKAERAVPRPDGADLRSSPPRAALTAACDCQRRLEQETAQLPGHSDARRGAQHLARLTSEILSGVAEHQAARDDPAGDRGKSPGTGPQAVT